jgi:hypothetical protein
VPLQKTSVRLTRSSALGANAAEAEPAIESFFCGTRASEANVRLHSRGLKQTFRSRPVCTENLIPVERESESRKLIG